ncbi:MAG: hypothetical protein A2036_01075 [Omnitrophica bacterium GWA2_50_21]|nr:MAG: hypothetical protein A2036_01075 [Omnitrophica bacterium GWA2_50_21]
MVKPPYGVAMGRRKQHRAAGTAQHNQGRWAALLFLIVFCLIPITSAIARDSDNPDFHQGMQFLKHGDYKQAEIRLQEAAKVIQKNPNLFLNLGNACRANKHWKQAFEAYEKAIAIDVTYAPAYTQMGRCYELMGNLEKAGAYYQKALDYDKNYLIGQIFMGWYLVNLEKYKKAEKYFDRVLEKSSFAVDALAGKGQALWRRGERSEAVFWFRKALALGYEDPEMEKITKKFDLEAPN